jgi:hypothetical protein
MAAGQGCQMVYFHTKNPNLGIHILEVLGIENVGMSAGSLECFTVIWYTLCPFGNFGVIWYIPSIKNLATLSKERIGSRRPIYYIRRFF